TDGVNIASATTNGWLPGGPWDAQANILNSLTEARDKADLSAGLAQAHLADQDVTQNYVMNLQKINEQIEELQRQIARPRPYRFVVQPTIENKTRADEP